MTPRITRIRARRLVSGPGYSNRALEAEAEVGDSRPEEVLRNVEEWIDDHMACPNLIRGFTPYDAEMLADQVRDYLASATNLRRRLLSILGEHEHVAYEFIGHGRRCRFCDEPMPGYETGSADPTETHYEGIPDIPF